MQIAFGQLVNADVPTDRQNIVISVFLALLNIGCAAGELQFFYRLGIEGSYLLLAVPDAIVKPGIGLCVGFPLAGAASRAAVKPFAGAVLLHRDTPAFFLLHPKCRVDPFFHKIRLHTQGYTLTSLPGGGIIVCAEVRQNLLYRAVTPSGKRFGNLLRCW